MFIMYLAVRKFSQKTRYMRKMRKNEKKREYILIFGAFLSKFSHIIEN